MKGLGRDELIGSLLGRAFRTRPKANLVDACPDAETLAAWIDAGLTGSERASVETHVADCARCQAQLAAVIRMTPAEADVQARSSSQLWRWRWLVPATAAAMAVALWVWVQPAPPPLFRQQTPQRQAPSAPAVEPSQERDETARRDTFRNRIERPFQDSGGRTNTAPPREEKRAADSAIAPPKRDQDVAKERALSAAERADTRRERVSGAAPAAPAPAPPPAAVAESAAPRPLDIMSPDPAVRWRISGSTIQRSTDGGQTWETQSTAIDARQFTAGASPLREVCWLVGRGGLVLLSTDGRTWRRLPFPEAVDLIGVSASSATSASITTADGRTLVTSDGGATWVATPPPD